MWDLSSPTRDQTCVPCFARQILYHWATRKVPWRIYFSIVCSADLQWQILWFCLFENMLCRLSVWNILLSWRIFLLDIEFLDWWFIYFSFSTWNVLFYCLLASIVSDEKSAVNLILRLGTPCVTTVLDSLTLQFYYNLSRASLTFYFTWNLFGLFC